MELTGAAKEAFEKWHFDNGYSLITSKDVDETGFYNLHDSMKYGVMVDWFDSIQIYIGKDSIEYDTHWVANYISGDEDEVIESLTRTEAIQKANEIYNKN